MRIAHITAGAGQMYCGSCLRDNTLAASLLDAGHEMTLIPTYTPARSEGRDVSLERIYMGGINVFLQEHVPFFRTLPRALTRWLDSPAVLRLATRGGVSVDPHELGRLTVSMLRGADGAQRGPVMELVEFLADGVAPEIVGLPNSLLIALAPAIKRRLDVPIVCTLQGEDGFLDSLGESYRAESIRLIREHAASVDAFVAVSDFCAGSMSAYLGIDRDRIHVVPVGVDVRGHDQAQLDADPFTIGYLARVAPEKGLHVLCEAYRRLRTIRGHAHSRLVVAGYLAPEHQAYFDDIQSKMTSWGLAGEFEYLGAPDRDGKLAFLRRLSVLSVPATRPNQKGQFLLEAMASGVPVVQPNDGVFTEVIERTGGGIVVEPGDVDSLVRGLLGMWDDSGRRSQLGAAAFDGVRRHYGIPQMLDRVMAVYHPLVARAARA
jgi:glycosyltransferase involved in cell wall biosynthesis